MHSLELIHGYVDITLKWRNLEIMLKGCSSGSKAISGLVTRVSHAL